MQIAIEILESSSPHQAIDAARAACFDGLCVPLNPLTDSAVAWSAWLSAGDGLRRELIASGIALASIHTGLSLDAGNSAAQRGALMRVRDAMSRAADCGCPRIIVQAGSAARETLDRRITRTTESLLALCDAADRAGVSILLDNRGSGLDSRALWLLRDGSSPARVRFAFDAFDAGVRTDSVSVSLKRLAGGLDIVYLDGAAAADSRAPTILQPAESVGAIIELLRGVAFRGWLCISNAAELQIATAATKRLRDDLARPEVVLSAYKGDKTLPRFAAQ